MTFFQAENKSNKYYKNKYKIKTVQSDSKGEKLSDRLTPFNIDEAKKSVQPNPTTLALMMTEYIYVDDNILLESQNPFGYIYKRLKNQMHQLMYEDDQFKQNVAYLLRSVVAF